MEYRTYLKLPSTILYKKDLYELEKILKDEPSSGKERMSVEFHHNETVFGFDSIEELFELKDLPKQVDNFWIHKSGWDTAEEDGPLNKSISIRLDQGSNFGSITGTNEDWFQGKKTRIKKFFINKRPFYHHLIPLKFFMPVISLLPLFLIVPAIKNNDLVGTIIYILFSLSLFVMSYLAYKDTIFSLTIIILGEKVKKQLDLNMIVIVLMILQIVIMLYDLFHS